MARKHTNIPTAATAAVIIAENTTKLLTGVGAGTAISTTTGTGAIISN